MTLRKTRICAICKLEEVTNFATSHIYHSTSWVMCNKWNDSWTDSIILLLVLYYLDIKVFEKHYD